MVAAREKSIPFPPAAPRPAGVTAALRDKRRNKRQNKENTG
jgi:hypothetical protein